MSKKIIGIVPSANKLFATEKVYEDGYYFVNNYNKRIEEVGGIPLGVLPVDGILQEDYMNLFNGFVICGGTKINKYHLQIVDHAVRCNKPILGICMGMQTITIYFLLKKEMERRKFSGNIFELYEKMKKEKYMFNEPVKGHRISDLTRDNIEKIKHKVTLKEDSMLYNIFNTKELNMPTLHSYRVRKVCNPLKIVGKAEDGTTEAVEYSDKIIGVQFHPENESINNELFKYIINKC